VSSASPGQRDARSLPQLHAVTDDEVLGRAGWEAAAIQVLEAGGPDVALHMRGPAIESRTLFDLVTTLAPHAHRSGATLIINDRVDVVLAADVDGVHLGEGSLPPEQARCLLGTEQWIGVSRHDPDGVAAAETEGADYVFLGTIFPTPSHPGVGGIGITGFRDAVERARGLPVLGIGGVGPGEAAELVGSGAYGVAAIRGIWDASDPGAAVTRYLEGVENGREQK
jgi:thiamine-phosphate pyrophosphorylase